MSLRTTAASLTGNLTSQRTKDHLVDPALLFKLKESHQLTIMSLLVLVNVDGFALCHKEWPSLSHKASTTWHMNLSWAKPMKTYFMIPTLNFKSE